jgi:hypothetical protein
MDILVDFDGTCTTHNFPNVGQEIGAPEVLRDLVLAGHRLILFTMRSDNNGFKRPDGKIDNNGLTDAVNWFEENDIPLYGIQENPTQKAWTSSPKAYGQLIIDDICLGIPLKVDPNLSERPFVDWPKCRVLMEELGIL